MTRNIANMVLGAYHPKEGIDFHGFLKLLASLGYYRFDKYESKDLALLNMPKTPLGDFRPVSIELLKEEVLEVIKQHSEVVTQQVLSHSQKLFSNEFLEFLPRAGNANPQRQIAEAVDNQIHVELSKTLSR